MLNENPDFQSFKNIRLICEVMIKCASQQSVILISVLIKACCIETVLNGMKMELIQTDETGVVNVFRNQKYPCTQLYRERVHSALRQSQCLIVCFPFSMESNECSMLTFVLRAVC